MSTSIRLPDRLWPALLVLLLLLSGTPAAGKVRVEPRGPELNPTTAQDWLRHPHDERYYQESWTAILRSTEGHILYLNFLYTNIGVFSGSTAVNLSLTLPGKKATHHRWTYETKDFAQDPASGRLRIGPDSMTLKGRDGSLQLKEKEVSLDLRLKGWVDGVKLHDGRLYLDKERWVETYFHVPRADVEGELTVGGKKMPFRGDGYLDHMVQNVLGTDYSTRWHTLRFFAPEHTVAFISWDTPADLGKERVVRLLVTDRKELLLFSPRMKLKTDAPRKDPEGHRYYNHFAFSQGEGGTGPVLQGELTGKRLHDRDAVLERLSWAERQVAGMVAGKPIFYRLEADTRITLTRPGQEPVLLEGTGLMESVVNREE